MRFDPVHEMEFSAQLAREYLEDAENRLKSEDFRGCVQYSQLASENAAKAVVATRRTPSWGHDPSAELLQTASELLPEEATKARRLAELSSRLAPEHGGTTYGEPGRFLTPRMLYDRQAAEEAVALAREGLQIMKEIISRKTQT